MTDGYRDFGFANECASHMHHLIFPALLTLGGRLGPGTRVLDVGCGNGFVAGELLQRGCEVVGVDLSATGIERARRAHPSGRFELMAADSGLLERLGCEPFDAVVSTEVVEHLYAPRPYARGCFDALRPGGRFICSTPYHGYTKNLVLSVLNKWDSHADPLWDGGHIKLWSRRKLTALLEEAGFIDLSFRGVGRVPGLWMTMLIAGDRPPSK